MRSRPLSTSMRRTRTFFNVLSPPLRDPLPARGALPRVAARNRGDDPRVGGGGGLRDPEPRLPAGRTQCQWRWQQRRYQPRRPPLGEAPGTRPPGRLEGVYTPTAHEGAPARGNGPGSSLGEGCSPGSGEGPHTAVGGWRYDSGHNRRGAAPPPPTGCDRRGSRRTPPPPSPPRGEHGPWGRPGGEHCLSEDRQRRGLHQLPTLRGRCPDLLTSEPSAAVMRTQAPCPQWAAHPPQLTRASGLAGTGAAASQIAPVPYWTRPAQVVVGTVALPAPAAPLLEWPQCPDPRPGWRVSIRPQPTRAPRARRWH